MPERHHVFLLPGFFGFDNLGDLAYFAHVVEALSEPCRRKGVAAEFRIVRTAPTASLRQRAASVVESIAAALRQGPTGAEPPPVAARIGGAWGEEAATGDDFVHLVGHSSGGLDARLVVTPEVSLPTTVDPAPIARRVRTVITVATPHHGTPLAGLFSSLLGQQLLQVFSLASSYALRTGRLPLDVLARLTAYLLRPAIAEAAASAEAGPSPGLDRLRGRLLADFAPDHRRGLEDFVRQIARDQDLLPQLTPAAMDLYNASTDDRPHVRYGSVVTQARGAGLRSFLGAGLSPYLHANHALFAAFERLAARMPADRVPRLGEAQLAALRRDLGATPDRRANDGIVPTLSQVWGEIIRAVRADHLDVIGHFAHPTHVPPHFDWLASGSGFSRPAFVALWQDVADFLFGR